MAYIITHTDGRVYGSIGDGVLDDKLGISLIGQNFHNYGQLTANNFLHLLEHHASPNQPTNPVEGMIWWNSETNVLSFFDGDKFKPCSSSAVGNSPPIKPLKGDQWWDTDVGQLKIFNDTDWVIVGPLYTKGQLFSGILPATVTDTSSNNHVITLLQIDGVNVAAVSKDPLFTLSTPLSGLTTLGPGITLVANTTLTGTSLNASKLGNINAAEYLVKTAASNTLNGSLLVNGTGGIVINNSLMLATDTISSTTGNATFAAGDVALRVSAAAGTITSSVEPTVNSSITTKLYVDGLASSISNSTNEYVNTQIDALINGSPIPTLNGLSAAINHDIYFAVNVNAALEFKANVASPHFSGSPTVPTPPTSDSSNRIATTSFVKTLIASGAGSTAIANNLVPIADNSIDIGSPTHQFRNIYGTAMRANYADLAEKYDSDKIYDIGTVVVFGGEKEITTTDQYCDHRIAGIISTNPAYLMNSLSNGLPVALTGKVLCKVYGEVKKGDILVNSRIAGTAVSIKDQAHWKPGCVIGKSLETNSEPGIKTIMVAVGRF